MKYAKYEKHTVSVSEDNCITRLIFVIWVRFGYMTIYRSKVTAIHLRKGEDSYVTLQTVLNTYKDGLYSLSWALELF